MNEEQARELWCPAARVGHTINRNNGSVNCIASDCMMWRWQSSLSVNNPSRVSGAAVQTVQQKHGYCGLGGKP